jgi:hypothetical protein
MSEELREALRRAAEKHDDREVSRLSKLLLREIYGDIYDPRVVLYPEWVTNREIVGDAVRVTTGIVVALFVIAALWWAVSPL